MSAALFHYQVLFIILVGIHSLKLEKKILFVLNLAFLPEKKMLAVPAPVSVTAIKENTVQPYSETLASDGPVNPPIITHTAATPMGTPMATPQGSPNESALKDSNKLAVSVNRTLNRSSLSVESDKTSVSVCRKGKEDFGEVNRKGWINEHTKKRLCEKRKERKRTVK